MANWHDKICDCHMSDGKVDVCRNNLFADNGRWNLSPQAGVTKILEYI